MQNHKKIYRYLRLAFFLLFVTAVPPTALSQTTDLRSIVEKRLKERYKLDLDNVCAIDTDVVAARVFSDYGAIFISNGALPPQHCLLESEAAVAAFQVSTPQETVTIGGVSVTLQKAAMKALLAARADAAKAGLAITPRGGAEASTRSYTKTVDLWNSRFLPGLTYWVEKRKITHAEAAAARRASTREQVRMVLEWEKRGIWFSTDKSKSILYSVAVPGASQHCFMLALDVEQFANARVRQILAAHGWFQTVKSDLPHFTYIGETEKNLTALGLTPLTIGGQEFWIPNM